ENGDAHLGAPRAARFVHGHMAPADRRRFAAKDAGFHGDPRAGPQPRIEAAAPLKDDLAAGPHLGVVHVPGHHVRHGALAPLLVEPPGEIPAPPGQFGDFTDVAHENGTSPASRWCSVAVNSTKAASIHVAAPCCPTNRSTPSTRSTTPGNLVSSSRFIALPPIRTRAGFRPPGLPPTRTESSAFPPRLGAG